MALYISLLLEFELRLPHIIFRLLFIDFRALVFYLSLIRLKVCLLRLLFQVVYFHYTDILPDHLQQV